MVLIDILAYAADYLSLRSGCRRDRGVPRHGRVDASRLADTRAFLDYFMHERLQCAGRS